MAIGTPVERYHNAASPGAIGSFAFSPLSNVTLGTTVILIDSNDGSNSLNLISSVADTKGNSWTVDYTHTTSANARGISIASAPITAAILTTDTITITYNGTNNINRSWSLQEVSGLAAAPAFDTSATADPTTSSAFSIGPTPGLATANEIAFAICREGFTPTVLTPGGSWTGLTTAVVGNCGMQYLIVSSNAALTATGSLNGSSDATAIGAVAVYKGAAAGGPSGTGLMLKGVS